jgi:hypothetical protein
MRDDYDDPKSWPVLPAGAILTLEYEHDCGMPLVFRCKESIDLGALITSYLSGHPEADDEDGHFDGEEFIRTELMPRLESVASVALLFEEYRLSEAQCIDLNTDVCREYLPMDDG